MTRKWLGNHQPLYITNSGLKVCASLPQTLSLELVSARGYFSRENVGITTVECYYPDPWLLLEGAAADYDSRTGDPRP